MQNFDEDTMSDTAFEDHDSTSSHVHDKRDAMRHSSVPDTSNLNTVDALLHEWAGEDMSSGNMWNADEEEEEEEGEGETSFPFPHPFELDAAATAAAENASTDTGALESPQSSRLSSTPTHSHLPETPPSILPFRIAPAHSRGDASRGAAAKSSTTLSPRTRGVVSALADMVDAASVSLHSECPPHMIQDSATGSCIMIHPRTNVNAMRTATAAGVPSRLAYELSASRDDARDAAAAMIASASELDAARVQEQRMTAASERADAGLRALRGRGGGGGEGNALFPLPTRLRVRNNGVHAAVSRAQHETAALRTACAAQTAMLDARHSKLMSDVKREFDASRAVMEAALNAASEAVVTNGKGGAATILARERETTAARVLSTVPTARAADAASHVALLHTDSMRTFVTNMRDLLLKTQRELLDMGREAVLAREAAEARIQALSQEEASMRAQTAPSPSTSPPDAAAATATATLLQHAHTELEEAIVREASLLKALQRTSATLATLSTNMGALQDTSVSTHAAAMASAAATRAAAVSPVTQLANMISEATTRFQNDAETSLEALRELVEDVSARVDADARAMHDVMAALASAQDAQGRVVRVDAHTEALASLTRIIAEANAGRVQASLQARELEAGLQTSLSELRGWMRRVVDDTPPDAWPHALTPEEARVLPQREMLQAQVRAADIVVRSTITAGAELLTSLREAMQAGIDEMAAVVASLGGGGSSGSSSDGEGEREDGREREPDVRVAPAHASTAPPPPRGALALLASSAASQARARPWSEDDVERERASWASENAELQTQRRAPQLWGEREEPGMTEGMDEVTRERAVAASAVEGGAWRRTRVPSSTVSPRGAHTYRARDAGDAPLHASAHTEPSAWTSVLAATRSMAPSVDTYARGAAARADALRRAAAANSQTRMLINVMNSVSPRSMDTDVSSILMPRMQRVVQGWGFPPFLNTGTHMHEDADIMDTFERLLEEARISFVPLATGSVLLDGCNMVTCGRTRDAVSLWATLSFRDLVTEFRLLPKLLASVAIRLAGAVLMLRGMVTEDALGGEGIVINASTMENVRAWLIACEVSGAQRVWDEASRPLDDAHTAVTIMFELAAAAKHALLQPLRARANTTLFKAADAMRVFKFMNGTELLPVEDVEAALDHPRTGARLRDILMLMRAPTLTVLAGKASVERAGRMNMSGSPSPQVSSRVQHIYNAVLAFVNGIIMTHSEVDTLEQLKSEADARERGDTNGLTNMFSL